MRECVYVVVPERTVLHRDGDIECVSKRDVNTKSTGKYSRQFQRFRLRQLFVRPDLGKSEEENAKKI